MAEDTFIEGNRPGTARAGQQRADSTFVEGGQHGGHYQPLPPSLAVQGYRAERELGAGAEARVLLCRDPQAQLVAVKLYFRAPKYTFELGSPEYLRHFSPDWAVEVLRRGVDRVAGTELHYEVMEYCHGGTLEEFVAAHGRHDGVATAIVKRLTYCLKNLQGAHSKVVHGDLKPRNVLVRNAERGDLVLSDFGLTIDLGERSNLSNLGQGTTAYNAPEIMRVKGAAADWWSLGMMMYTVLVGRGYYQIDADRWMAQHAIEADLISRDVDLVEIDKLTMPAERRARWKTLFAGLLTRDPDKRWGAAQVEAWLNGESPPVHRPLEASSAAAGDQPQHAQATRTVDPFPFAGVGEFRTPAELGAAMAERPSDAARMLSGKGVNRLVSWLTTDVRTNDDYSELSHHNWDPDAKASYFVSRLAPSAPLTFRGQPVGAPSDLIRLAQNGDQEVIRALFDADLLGRLADQSVRSGYRMIGANWHDVVTRVDDLAARHSIPLDERVREHVRRVSLAVTAAPDSGAAQSFIDSVRRRAEAPGASAATELDSFVGLRTELSAASAQRPSNETVALAILLDGYLDEARRSGQDIRDQRAAAVRREEQSAASAMTDNDVMATMFAGFLGITVLAPWLIGHFLMTKTFVLKPDSRVYQDDVRGLGDHFFATYLAGLIPILLLLGIFLVARGRRSYRRVSVIGGAVALVGSLALLTPFAMDKWQESENKTIATLRETPFPFAKQYLSCESWKFHAENGIGQFELWQVHLGQTMGTKTRGCNRINVYRGWQYVGAYDLGDGDEFTGEITVNNADWGQPYTTKGSEEIFQRNSTTGLRTAMNPIGTHVSLKTAYGRSVEFSLDGAGRNGFELR